MKKFIPFSVLIIVIILALVYPSVDVVNIKDSLINSGDTAWLLVSTALVLIMTPGLAFFYGGMVSKKNVLSTMMQSFVCMGVITIIWVNSDSALLLAMILAALLATLRHFL
jgi:Amt family ammonium transporter